MSAIGKKWSLISVGISCQTSHQIRTNIDLLKRESNDLSLRISAFVFDWLICPPTAASKIISDGRFYPEQASALELNVRPYWPEQGAHFWHDFPDGNIADHHANVKAKYAHLAAKVQHIRASENIVAVVSNTQNNLDWLAQETGSLDPAFRLDELVVMKDAIDAWFGRKVEMLIVTYQDDLPDRLEPRKMRTFRIARDETPWRGDAAEWQRVFQAYFRNRTTPVST